MDEKMSGILAVMGEMHAFSRIDDALSDLVDRYDDGEIAEDDLELIAAASARPPYSEFLKKL